MLQGRALTADLRGDGRGVSRAEVSHPSGRYRREPGADVAAAARMASGATMAPSGGRACGALVAAALALAASVAWADPVDSGSAEDVTEDAPTWSFRFGSYGRIVGATDLQGGSGRQVNVVSHGPRLEEEPYLELDFGTTYRLDAFTMDTVLTLAMTDALFHLDGDFDGTVALRNAYVRAGGFGVDGLSLWAGSRMLRGDDVYLLDFWPMDNLNTVGGGARYDIDATNTSISAHGGMAQLRDRFQFQEIEVAGPSFETEQFLLLDRSRAVGTLRLEQRFPDLLGALSAKVVLYGEAQSLPSGEFENDDQVRLPLPAERGYALGAQLGAWGWAENGFANLFFRYATGLAAYGELAVPRGLADDRSAGHARLVRIAASANHETRWFGATAGGYVQWFDDADDNRFDPDDYTEGVFSVRPVVFITDHFHQAVEASYQRRLPGGLSARTDTYLEPAMWKFAVMPTLSAGRAVYSRPQLRLIYSASLLNAGARDQWPEGDRRHERATQHFLGVGAEWWFNSSSYQ